MTPVRFKPRDKAMAVFTTLLVVGSMCLIGYEIYTTIIVGPKPA